MKSMLYLMQRWLKDYREVKTKSEIVQLRKYNSYIEYMPYRLSKIINIVVDINYKSNWAYEKELDKVIWYAKMF